MRVGSVALVAGIAGLACAGWAEVPRVVADIAPVQGLVARVMDGVGTPALVLRPGASPHDHALRPSEAAALDGADLVVWIGPELTPWLERALATMAPEARVVGLLDLPQTRRLPVREDVDPADDDHAAEGHGHHGTDPHAWLDPDNAALWLGAIAEALARADPPHAQLYRDNAGAGAAEIAAAARDAAATLAPVQGDGVIVLHDAFQYFEASFGLQVAGAVALSDAAAPGPARLARLRDLAEAQGVHCLLAERPVGPRVAETVFRGRPVGVALADPLGADIAPGPGFYPALLRMLADRIAGCG